jgi:hypothetical protein
MMRTMALPRPVVVTGDTRRPSCWGGGAHRDATGSCDAAGRNHSDLLRAQLRARERRGAGRTVARRGGVTGRGSFAARGSGRRGRRGSAHAVATGPFADGLDRAHTGGVGTAELAVELWKIGGSGGLQAGVDEAEEIVLVTNV